MAKIRGKSILILICFMVSMSTSCRASEKVFQKNNSDKTIPDVIDYLGEEFSISGQNEMRYDLIGAIDGCRITLNETYEIEIYKYDISNAEKKNILENCKKSGTIMLMGFQIPVLVNGSFIITGLFLKPNENYEKLKEYFQNFR